MKDSIGGAVCNPDGCSTVSPAASSHQGGTAEKGRLHHLTIVSDVICPWCYIAKRRVGEALKLVGPELRLRIEWKPFQLNPDMPKDGMDRRVYRSQKFGSWEHSQALDAQVKNAGMSDGISFRHDLISRTPNTFEAHRLIWLAGKEDVQDAVVEALFRAYLTEGRDVGDTSVLIDIAAEAGLDKENVAAFFSGTAGTDEVRLEMQRLMSAGTSGVPTFALDGEELFSGALKPDKMAALFEEALDHDKR